MAHFREQICEYEPKPEADDLPLAQRWLRPSKGFWGSGENGIYFGEQGNKGQSLRDTKTLLGNKEHKKFNFRFWEQGNKPIYFRGTREQVPPGKASLFSFVKAH